MAPGSCARRFAALPLAGTNWRLTRLDGSPVPTPTQGQAGIPALTFRDDPGTFSGSGGCNRFTGPYDVRGETLTLTSAGTLRVCPGLSASEAAFKSALTDTRRYRILGDVLELSDGDRQLVARFEGR
jgi:putative lipoprotein